MPLERVGGLLIHKTFIQTAKIQTHRCLIQCKKQPSNWLRAGEDFVGPAPSPQVVRCCDCGDGTGCCSNLHAVLLLPFKVLLVQGVDTVNHGLDKLDLGVSQSVLVGDVVGVSGLAARLSSGATGLNSELLAPGPELVNALLGPAGKVNVDGGPHAGTQVGWGGVDVAELLGQLEVLARLGLDTVADSLDATSQAREDSLDVTALLHGDDASLVLLIDPDQESLGLVVEDATALRPVTLHTSNLQVGVTRHEEEVVIDELLTDLLVHAS